VSVRSGGAEARPTRSGNLKDLWQSPTGDVSHAVKLPVGVALHLPRFQCTAVRSVIFASDAGLAAGCLGLDQSEDFQRIAQKLGWALTGPQHACLIQGDDHLGALAEIHKRLRDANVNIYASTGVTDGDGRYGYVIYVKEEDHQSAAKALAP
jgi:hypothetical protein